MAGTTLDDRYARALGLLAAGRPAGAEALLTEGLVISPRAAQSIYLLGISLLAQGRFGIARQVSDRAYAVKPWLRDVSAADFEVADLARQARRAEPDWLWPRYELERNAHFSLSLSLPTVVERHLSHPDVTFVEIGANDGRDHDPIYEFVRTHGWNGVALEPIPQTYEALAANYAWSDRVVCVQAALTDHDGAIEMHLAGNSKLASIVPDRNAMRGGTSSSSVTVPAMTFATLVQRHGVEQVDVLQIDTEGYDYEVLRTFDFEARRPLVINMEFYCLPLAERLATFALLRQHGYAYRFGGMDLLAIDSGRAAAEFCLTDLTGGADLPDRSLLAAVA